MEVTNEAIAKKMMYLSRLHKQRIGEAVSEFGLFTCQTPALLLIARHGSPMQKALAAELSVSPPTMSAALQRMEKAGVVTRNIDGADARAVRVTLTEKGTQLVGRARAAIRVADEKLLSGFSELEKTTFYSFLERAEENLAEGNLL